MVSPGALLDRIGGVDQATLDRFRRAAGRVFERRPVIFAYLFGAVARDLTRAARREEEAAGRRGQIPSGTGSAHKSIDVAVYLDPSVPHGNFIEASVQLGERLSGASGKTVNVLVLNGARLPVQGRVLQEGLVLYSRDEPERREFEARTLRQYEEHQNEVRPQALHMLRELSRGRLLGP